MRMPYRWRAFDSLHAVHVILAVLCCPNASKLQQGIVPAAIVSLHVQGIVTTSPAIDVQRDLALRVLQVLKPLLLHICPNARLVPAIPVEENTPIPEVVRLSASACSPYAQQMQGKRQSFLGIARLMLHLHANTSTLLPAGRQCAAVAFAAPRV